MHETGSEVIGDLQGVATCLQLKSTQEVQAEHHYWFPMRKCGELVSALRFALGWTFNDLKSFLTVECL